MYRETHFSLWTKLSILTISSQNYIVIYPAQYIYSRRRMGFKLNQVLPAVIGFYVDKIPPLSDV